MYQNLEDEWHPWLKLFTIMGVPAGLLFLIPSTIDIYDALFKGFGTGDYLTDIFNILWGGIILYASIRTLGKTDYFRKWSSCVSLSDKIFAYIAIIMGFGVCIGLIFAAPIYRFMTDSIGGGRQ
jgi:hypothetical protein